MEKTVYTLGHSNHRFGEFLGLLRMHSIGTVADVRSRPYSRWHPQYNRETLERSLHDSGIGYRFLGKELGARPEGSATGHGNRLTYAEIAKTCIFQAGLEQVRALMATGCVALLCAERDPLFCHRAILVSRHLRVPEVRILHILADGGIEAHEDLERRMLEELGWNEEDLFVNRPEAVERAYEAWEERLHT